MHAYSLNIAGYKIRFESTASGPGLVPAQRFAGFIEKGKEYDVLIKVHDGQGILPPESEMVFNAPYVEETDGVPLKKNDEFWSVYKNGSELYIKTLFPYSGFTRAAILKFSRETCEWDLWPGTETSEADPMEYPLDGLILYYLTAINNDIMIHASGINHAGRGYMFSGVSGKGKSTMAGIWNDSGASVIHDDRLIIRKTGSGFRFFNTPVYNNDTPRESDLDAIFLIEHGKTNASYPITGAAAVSLVMANCIQHNWDMNIVGQLIGSVTELCAAVPVKRLEFVPDKSVIHFILNNG